MPANPAEAMSEPTDLLSSQWTLCAAITKEIRPTSIASSAQPMPEAPSSFPCLRVKGSRSRRCDLVSGPEAVVAAGGVVVEGLILISVDRDTVGTSWRTREESPGAWITRGGHAGGAGPSPSWSL